MNLVNLDVSVNAKRIIIAGAFLLICFFSTANERSKSGSSTFVTKFSFQTVSGGFIIIKAKLAGFSKLLYFMLDTGCSGVSLDSSLVAELGLTPEASDQQLSGLTSKKNVQFVNNRSLHLQGLQLDSLNFHINKYDFFEETYGMKIDGVIGYPLLEKFIVKVDYANEMIEIWTPGAMKYPAKGFTFYPSFTPVPYLDATIKENAASEGRYVFDTGADLCLMFDDKFVKDSSFMRDNKKVINLPANDVVGQHDLKLTTVDHIQVGPYSFQKIPSMIFTSNSTVSRYPFAMGIIGNELLRRFNIVFNYPSREINLLPNASFKEAFNYNYTGFGIFSSGGKIVVDNIMKDSPAEKAGLRSNDIVLGVKNNFDNDIIEYKKIIQTTSKTLELSVLRDNVVHNLVLQVDRLL
jgi:hypothetical protein